MRAAARVPGWARKAAIFSAGIAFTSQFFIVWCDLIYDCGCVMDMWGGADHCNIQQAGAPDCPWCADATYGGIAFGTTIAVQAAAAFWPGSAALVMRTAATLAASPLASGLAGLAIGLHSGYWS